MGSVSTPTCWPRIASCSIAAGRLVSSEAISTRLCSRSLSLSASLAVVVVLPEPCRPTIRMGAGGLSMRSARGSRSPGAPASIETISSWTILTTCWPGVTDFVTACPVAFSCTAPTKSRATGSDTSASKSATRTSRSAVLTSSSPSAPWRVSRSMTPDRRSDRVSNMASLRDGPRLDAGAGASNADDARGRNSLAGGDPGTRRDRKGLLPAKRGG